MRGVPLVCGGLLWLGLGCGGGGGSTDSAGGTGTTAATGNDSSTGGAPTTGDGTTAGQSGSDSQTMTGTVATTAEPTSTGDTTESAVTGATDVATTTGEPGTTTVGETTSTTGDPPCEIADVEDTLAFTYSKSIDIAPIGTIQASFYNQDAKEIVFFSFFGQGRRYTLDGTPIGDVMAPPEALPSLDGATFDQVNRTGLLLTQGCKIVEVDPVTMATIATIQLDTVRYGLNVCAGLAIGVDGHMYVNSYFTDKILVVTRDGQTEIASIDLVPLGLPSPDGISLIAGSPNFLVLSTAGIRSAILSPEAEVLVGPNVTGQDQPPMIGGAITNPDAILTVCGNGHAWLCDEYGTKCHDYVPMDGDKDACACTIPQ